MKKIDLILNGKVDAKLIDTKKAKITKAIEVGILNAEDDLLGKELEYERLLVALGGNAEYSDILAEMVAIKEDILTIKAGIHALQEVQNDLNEDIEEKSEEYPCIFRIFVLHLQRPFSRRVGVVV